MRLLHGLTTRGDAELAVDGFDLGSYGAWGDVEALCHLPGRELAAEQAKYVELALCELLAEMPIPLCDRAKFPVLALEQLGDNAGIRGSFQDGSHLGERRPTPGSVATRGSYRRDRQQPDEGGPGAQARQHTARAARGAAILLRVRALSEKSPRGNVQLGDESLPSCNETTLVYREASGVGESKGELQGSVEANDG